MDKHPFTAVAQAEARVTLTRHRFCSLVFAALSTAFGFGRGAAAAARCRKKSARCDRSSQCCSNRCRRGFCYPRRR